MLLIILNIEIEYLDVFPVIQYEAVNLRKNMKGKVLTMDQLMIYWFYKIKIFSLV